MTVVGTVVGEGDVVAPTVYPGRGTDVVPIGGLSMVTVPTGGGNSALL